MNVKAEPKDGVVTVHYTKKEGRAEAKVVFVDQFGIDRILIVKGDKVANLWKVVEFTLDGKASVIAPSSSEPGVKNAYEEEK